MTCKARSPQVLHPYHGDESLPSYGHDYLSAQNIFFVSVQSERFSRDGNHRYIPSVSRQWWIQWIAPARHACDNILQNSMGGKDL